MLVFRSLKRGFMNNLSGSIGRKLDEKEVKFEYHSKMDGGHGHGHGRHRHKNYGHHGYGGGRGYNNYHGNRRY